MIEHQPAIPVIHIGEGLLERLPTLWNMKSYTKLLILTDERVPQSIRQRILRTVPIPASELVLPSGEQSKSIDTVIRIWNHLHTQGFDRKSIIINVGGGVIGDVGGFAASTYMRGIDWINIPTTVLSQVDASIGGKTGINLGDIKNLVGTFKQPRAVIVDVDTLESLPLREMQSGFAEIIKHGIVNDAAYFTSVTSKKPQEFTKKELAGIIRGSIDIKSAIVRQDPWDMGVRKTLNFGHTVGHAIEAVSQTGPHPLTHGEAVAIGMAVEASVSERVGLLTKENKNTIIHALEHADLPTKLPPGSLAQLHERMNADKKNSGGDIRWVLPIAIGKAIFDVHVDPAIVNSVLQEAQII